MTDFIEIPASKLSMSKRKPVFGIGINDAKYIVQPIINNEKIRCPIYVTWLGMMTRCYSEKYQNRQPTYKGCIVCDEWLTFSNFRSWMIDKEWRGLDLDKDIITPGNKIYSPKNCRFISPGLNKLLNDRLKARGKYPKGVIWNKNANKFQSQVNINGKNTHLGYFSTITGARRAYVKSKIKIILAEAINHSDDKISNGLREHAKILIDSI